MKRLYLQNALNYAKGLREGQTDCENILWQNLRGKRLNNIKFRRQVPIGKYIVDFVALDKKVIVELDGSQHLDDNQLIYDKNRTIYLEKYGYKVLRIYNNYIFNNLEDVLNFIAKECED
jgi:very-short-patch-repair endonuclease